MGIYLVYWKKNHIFAHLSTFLDKNVEVNYSLHYFVNDGELLLALGVSPSGEGVWRMGLD